MVYRLPRAIDLNAASRLIRDKPKLLIVGRCLEAEKPWVLERFPSDEYAKITVCLEAEHVNHVGFKVAGILARVPFKEVAVVTTDGSMHCVQLHFMVEEIFKIMRLEIPRKHYVVAGNELVEVPAEAVRTARYLSKVAKLLERCADSP
ncbi:hypothetical protein PYJP_17860 [Pyrofollis japonicus]|nr:hypothetical protein PYJP_17860 [Pyrofollis japonicus]